VEELGALGMLACFMSLISSTAVFLLLIALARVTRRGKQHAFLTGSHAYGNARPDSDVDLVIRIDPRLADWLKQFSDEKEKLMFGKLNLICATDDEYYEIWRRGTDLLKSEGVPPTRDQAVELFKSLKEGARKREDY